MGRVITTLMAGLALGLLCAAEGDAATIHAASCAVGHVQKAVNAAATGDTVMIPSCPEGVPWPRPLVVTKGLTIRGAGIGVTVLLDDVPKGDPVNCADARPMVTFRVPAPRKWRLTGLTIRGSAPDPAICQPGHVGIESTSKAWRIDHVSFENQRTAGIRVDGDTWGVVDHSHFKGRRKQGVIVGHSRWGGGSYGDGSWAEPLTLGTEKAVYVEDCVFVDPDPIGAGAMDVFDGGRVVFRHNRATFFATHGTESSGRRRGARSYEIYGNTFNAGSLVAVYTAINLRGGTGVIYDNRFKGDYTAVINVQNFRDTAPYHPWGQCNGSSLYDENQLGRAGYACLDQVGRSTGVLLSGDIPLPMIWPEQAREPLYQWGNTKNGVANPTIQSSSRNIRANRDFINNEVKPGYTPFPYPHPLTLR